ncbi:MAG: tetratricopeptide repeat protein [Planctomycetes bacterium]|nr:tetratricopeptide repeat protein [Planctomycetota bacterium]
MDTILQEAVDLIREGYCEDALSRLDLIPAERLDDPDRVEFLYWKGTALSQLDRFEEAEEVLREGIGRFPDEGRLYRSLGQLFSEAGREERCLLYFAKAAELMPGDAATAYEWGYALYKLEKDSAAVEHFREALAINPRCASAVQYLGEIYESQEEQEKALETYQEYFRSVDDDYSLLVEAAICLSDMERFEEAARYYECAIQVNTHYVYAYYNWAVSLWRSGQMDQALVKIQECLEVDPEFPLGWMLWGRLQLAMGQTEDALTKLQDGMNLARDGDEDNVEMMSWCYEGYFEAMVEMRRLEDAQAIFWEAARANLLTPAMLERHNMLYGEESESLCLWWVLVDVRLFEPVPVNELDGEEASGYLCGFDVLARNPDEAVDLAIEFEKQLGEGEAVAEECLVQEEEARGFPGISWVYPNRNYYSHSPDEEG